MKRYKLLWWILLILAILFLLLAMGYQRYSSRKEITSFSVHSQNLNPKLLIAAQQSSFKDALVQKVIHHFEKDSMFIQVIDVAELGKIDPNAYHVILILYSWEFGSPPKIVSNFLSEQRHQLKKMIVLTTSWYGGQVEAGVDGMAGASTIHDVKLYGDWLVMKLEIVLESKPRLAGFDSGNSEERRNPSVLQ